MKTQFVRMHTMAFASVLALGGALTGIPASAATTQPQAPAATTLAARSASGIQYLNGGIGAAEQQEMRQDAHNWPVRITFSQGPHGAFVADTDLKVTGQSGKVIFNDKDAGPMTYLRLAPGTYRISASYAGKTLSRQVHVGRAGENIYFNWEGHRA